MEDKVSKLVKKILSEQGVGKDGVSDEIAAKFTATNSGLKMAYQAGCFPKGSVVHNLDGNQVILFQTSTKIPNYPYAVMYGPKDNENTGNLVYYKPDLKEKDQRVFTWSCAALRQLKQDSLNPELTTAITNIRTNNPNLEIYSYGDETLGSDRKYNGSCKIKTLDEFIKERPDLQSIMPKNTQVMIWHCSQIQGGSNSAQVKAWEEQGYRRCTDLDLVDGAKSVDVKDAGGIKMCKSKRGTGLDNNQTYKSLKEVGEKVYNGQINKENCRLLVDLYGSAAGQQLPIPKIELDNTIKPAVRSCYAGKGEDGKDLKLDNIFSKKFQKLKNDLNYMPAIKDNYGKMIDYKLSSGVDVRESKDMLLKSLIRENLMTLSESKKKVLIEENKIITNRFSVIIEGVEIKTNKQKSKIVSDLVNEAMTLNGQGFNQTLINEQFWDMIKSFFGNTGTSVVQMISERIAQAIITTLTPLDKNGWVANIIVTTIGNIPPADYVNGKIFSCDYISDKLSKGIVEGMARKIQNEQGMEGPIYDIIRNSMVEMAEDTSFGMKIETMIGDLICPMLSGVKSKMDGTAETLKAKALA
jgi:hypothetical protein